MLTTSNINNIISVQCVENKTYIYTKNNIYTYGTNIDQFEEHQLKNTTSKNKYIKIVNINK